MNHSPVLVPARPRGRVRRAGEAFRNWFRRTIGARPLQPPRLRAHRRDDSATSRLLERLRYTVLRFEYWISPNGTVRAILRLCLRAAAFVAIPTVLVGPVVLLFLDGAAAAAGLLAAIGASLLAFVKAMVTVIAGIVLLSFLVRMLGRR